MWLGGETIFQADKSEGIAVFEQINSGLFQVAKRAAGNLRGDGIDLPSRGF